MPKGRKSTFGNVLKKAANAVFASRPKPSGKKRVREERALRRLAKDGDVSMLKRGGISSHREEDTEGIGLANQSFAKRNGNVSAAAAYAGKLPKVGMSDIEKMRIVWQMGYIYVGNGVLGANDQVYFIRNDATTILLGNIPILGSDAQVGATYISDIEKHFARKVVHDCNIRLHALQPATTNSMEVVISPIRGANGTDDATASTGTPAASAYQLVASMVDCMQATSWQEALLRLGKRYIAGGSGAAQNEFDLDAVSSAFIGQSNDAYVPCAFVVSGISSTAALRGTRTHVVMADQLVSYRDFLGLNVNTDLPDFMKKNDERRKWRAVMERMLLTMQSTPFANPLAPNTDQKDVKSNDPKSAVAIPSSALQTKSYADAVKPQHFPESTPKQNSGSTSKRVQARPKSISTDVDDTDGVVLTPPNSPSKRSGR